LLLMTKDEVWFEDDNKKELDELDSEDDEFFD
jgi:hypothetical protein